MKRKNEWHASSDGPDAMDVMMASAAIQELNGLVVTWHLSVSGGSKGATLGVSLLVTMDGVLPGGAPRDLALSATWPNGKGQNLYQVMMDLVYQMDRLVLEKWYRQETLPGA